MSDKISSSPVKHEELLQNTHFKNNNHPTLISQKLYEFYQTNQFVDIDLIVGPDTFRIQAHRVILSASSEYFFDAFTRRPNLSYLEIPEVDVIAMEWVLRFLYTSSIELESTLVSAIFKAAVLFKITILIETCLTFMEDNINAENCLGFAKLAWDYDSRSRLLKKSLAFAHDHFEEMRKQGEFFEMSPEILRELFTSDFLQVSTEEVVLQNLIDWANFDPQNRHRLLPDLLGVVRHEMLDPIFLTQVRESIRDIPKCDDVVFSWIACHIENQHRQIIPKIRARNMSHYYSILCGSSTDDWNIMTYNGILDTWSREMLPKSPRKRTYFKAVKTVNNRVIISGGKINGEPTKSVECFDLQTKTWLSWPAMCEARLGHIMAMIKGSLFVMGGFSDQSSPLLSVEKYNMSKRSWDIIGIMPSPIEYAHRYAIVNGRIYFTNVYRPSRLKCLDSMIFEWTWHDFDHEVKKVVDMVAIGDDLYLYLVDAECEKIIARFSSTEEKWTQLPTQGIDRFTSMRMFALSNKLIFWGKASDGSDKVLVELYDPQNGDFTSLTPLKEVLFVLNNK